MMLGTEDGESEKAGSRGEGEEEEGLVICYFLSLIGLVLGIGSPPRGLASTRII